jgi:hypothetical protein
MPIPYFLEKFSYQEIAKKLAELDPALKDILDGEIGGTLLETILARYDFDFQHFSDLMMLLGLYLARIVSNQEFVDELAQLIPEKYFSQFMQEMENKLWSPYDVYLNKASIVYKQLTKLTPRKIEREETGEKLEEKEEIKEDKQEPAASGQEAEAVDLEPQKTEELIISAPAPGESAGVGDKAKTPETLQTRPAFSGEARISFEKLKNFVPKTQEQRPEPPVAFGEGGEAMEGKPEIESVQFTVPESKPDLAQEISAQSEEKQVEIPKPPKVPKTEVEGKEVIDLSSFGLTKLDQE